MSRFGAHLNLRKIAIWLSKNCQKISFFQKKNAKNFHFFKKKRFKKWEGQYRTNKNDNSDYISNLLLYPIILFDLGSNYYYDALATCIATFSFLWPLIFDMDKICSVIIPLVSDLAWNVLRLAPTWDKSGIFKIVSLYFDQTNQNVLKTDFKKWTKWSQLLTSQNSTVV